MNQYNTMNEGLGSRNDAYTSVTVSAVLIPWETADAAAVYIGFSCPKQSMLLASFFEAYNLTYNVTDK